MSKAHLWMTVSQHTVLYGREAIATGTKDVRSMESMQGTLIKSSVHLGKRSHHSALLEALGIPTIEGTLLCRASRLHNSIMCQDSPARQISLHLLSKVMAGLPIPPGTLLARMRRTGHSPFGFDPPLQYQSSRATNAGVVDSIKELLCNEQFLKPYSNEYILLKLLTRSF